MIKIALLSSDPTTPLADAVIRAGWQEHADVALVPEDDAEVLLLVLDNGEDRATWDRTVQRAAGRPLLVVLASASASLEAVGDRAGLTFHGWTRSHETRVRPIGVDPRHEGDLEVVAGWATGQASSDVAVLATANQAFTDHPVLTWRPSTGVGVATFAAEPGTWRLRRHLRLVRRWADHALGQEHTRSAGVGLLAFGAIGAEHAEAVSAVPGLDLAAVCDKSQERLAVASALHPGVFTTQDAEALLSSDSVDVVVISTPPDSHAQWALRVLESGKHVVLEKPMALSAQDCDKVLAAAADRGLTAVVYQNRRYDSDFITLRAAVQAGRLGTLFHVETFVGGFGHPCNYWHSDATVSGGAIFDWGSHFIDQVLNLMPGALDGVSARNHKLRWHDVTNADHARVTLHYADGAEATFIHSDLAAAAKPKYYVLGTDGAVVGHWNTERIVSRTAIGTAQVDVFAPADAPADLDLVDAEGSVTRLAPRVSPAYAFHRDLADLVLEGLPMEVTAAQSRRVVAVMEAAEISAATGGGIVPVP